MKHVLPLFLVLFWVPNLFAQRYPFKITKKMDAFADEPDVWEEADMWLIIDVDSMWLAVPADGVHLRLENLLKLEEKSKKNESVYETEYEGITCVIELIGKKKRLQVRLHFIQFHDGDLNKGQVIRRIFYSAQQVK